MKMLQFFSPSGGGSKTFRRTFLAPVLAVFAAAALPFSASWAAGTGASAWAANDHAAARLIAPATGVGSGDTVSLGVHFRLQPGWKIYWRSPGDAGVPPSIDWAGSLNLESARMSWPVPERYSIFGLTTFVYGGEVVLPLRAKVKQPGQALALRARLSYLVCEKVCIPMDARLDLDLAAGPGETVPDNARLIARFAGQVPPRLAEESVPAAAMAVTQARLTEQRGKMALEVLARSKSGFQKPDLLVEGGAPLRYGLPRRELSADSRVALFRIPVTIAAKGASPPDRPVLTLTLVDGSRAVEQQVTAAAKRASGGPGARLLIVLGLALLGGLILNLMPCVLPVLSIKVLSVVGHGGAESAAVRRGFLATAAGILFSFLILAAGAIALKFAGAAVGWGIQFQSPYFLTAMAGVLVLFSANMFGLFEIPLPGFAGGAAAIGGGKSLGGAFATGAFATLLATPCSAPFLGTAIGFALSRGWGEILLVFAALGLGLAAPYLVVAAWPRIATGLPRPGRWMVILRRVLGAVLLLTALWLISVLSVVAGVIAASVTGALLIAALAALALRPNLAGAKRRLSVLAAFCLALALMVPAIARDADESAAGATVDAGIEWQVFDHVALLNHVAQGRVVFVDVTADWCVTCKANKALVIDRGEVAVRLRSSGIVAMRADWTRPDEKIAAYLRGFGRFGIPFNAVYGPRVPSGIVLSELLSAGEVLAALDSAAVNGAGNGQ